MILRFDYFIKGCKINRIKIKIKNINRLQKTDELKTNKEMKYFTD